MDNTIKAYYRAERISNIAFTMYAGGVSTGALVHYLWKPTMLNMGLMIGFCLIGTFQIIVGLVRFYRTFTYYDLSIESVDGETNYLPETEIPRIHALEQRFHNFRNISTGIIILGFAMTITCIMFDASRILLGTSMGLMIHAGFLFAFDMFSQFRAQEYLQQLKKVYK